LRLQLRFLDHREHLPFFHMVADIIVDLRDIPVGLGVKIGGEKRLDGRRDDNGGELWVLVITFSHRQWGSWRRLLRNGTWI